MILECCILAVMVLPACKPSPGGTADPKLPRPVAGPAADVAPPASGTVIDWSFLGAPNPALVREQALHIRPVAAVGNLAEDPEIIDQLNGEAVRKWVGKHVSIAATGSAGVVRMTWTHCVGWGSNVPSDYTVHGCFTPFVVFVHAVGAPDFVEACRACSREDSACIEDKCSPRHVEGYFTGKKLTELNDPEDPDSARHSWEFHVLRATPAGGSPVEPTAIDPAMELLLPAGSPQPDGAPIAQGQRFAVVSSFDRVWAPTSLTLAQKLQDQLKLGGYQAHVIDSRLVRTQGCCSHLVIAARAATAAEAERIRKDLAAKNLGKFEVIELY
ncbi:MAG: hypothetical protein CVU65_17040 [Deltaproteobacteria bacterium HGW-Deltaproteobacteria-22]|jgi:hypothetical protein|nr:MAG: hypothetical protein CVU65_17040 [Deltaproteobacteria bacterium HGW-Deltaproteobacteria-22]